MTPTHRKAVSSVKKVMAGTVGLVMIFTVGGANVSTSQPSTKVQPNPTIAKMPEKARRAVANMLALATGGHMMADLEARNPQTVDEILSSDYLPVEPKDLINPYTDDFVEVLPWQDFGLFLGVAQYPTLEEAKPLLGNISFQSYPEGGFKFNVYYDPENAQGTISFFSFGMGKKTYQRTVLFQSGDEKRDRDYQDYSEKRRALVRSLNSEIRKLFARCEYIATAMTSATLNGFPLPLTWEALKATGLVAEVRNPFTGQPISDVSHSSPRPGDFTYAGIFLSNKPTRFDEATPICYTQDLKPVNPWKFENLNKFSKMENEGTFFDKDGVRVTRMVHIH
jgi:hypothetical protein